MTNFAMVAFGLQVVEPRLELGKALAMDLPPEGADLRDPVLPHAGHRMLAQDLKARQQIRPLDHVV